MSATSETAALGHPATPSTELAIPESSHGAFPVLVALADDGFAAAVVQVAEALTLRRGAHPALLYVMEITPPATSDGLLGVSTSAMMQELFDVQSLQRDEGALRKTLHLDAGLPATWPLTIELGQVPSSIMQRAQQSHVELIIMGLHHHGAIGRALGNDTVREVMAFGGIPVFAVRPELVTLPKSVVVAVDFSQASLRAAHLARRLMDDAGTLHLVFIEPAQFDPSSESEEGRALIEARGVESAFQQLAADLHPGPGLTIVPLCATGNAVAELTRVCEQVQPDLFAIGSQRHRFFERLRLGSVATAMVHDGRWSVLVTPPAEKNVPAAV